MLRTTIKKPILVLAFLTGIGSVHLHASEAGDSIQEPSVTSQAKAQVVRGRDLMTDAERDAMRKRMQAATSEAERAQLRAENHAKMQLRAQERGLTLRGNPPDLF